MDSSCTAFRALSYAVPSAKVETVENKYDTPETVAEIQDHNARWDALCVKGK